MFSLIYLLEKKENKMAVSRYVFYDYDFGQIICVMCHEYWPQPNSQK
jgi:hypothetical protein